jgi:hypothetical protein
VCVACQIQLDATVPGRVAKLESLEGVDVWGVRNGLVDVMVPKDRVAEVDPAHEGRLLVDSVQALIDRTTPAARTARYARR